MITKYYGVNISSPNPEKLVRFYHEKLEVPILKKDLDSYDETELGFIEGPPAIIVWDENR